jgi:hypothetical protein
VAVVLMLSSPPQGRATRDLCDRLNLSSRTVQRWRKWWTSDFPRTPFWQTMRSRFMPPLAGGQLPASLLERFDAVNLCDRLTKALRFVCPLSVTPVSLCEGRVLSRRGCR